MKKIAIVTINGNYNYGNRLQNYALKCTLEKYNLKVTNLWFVELKQFIKDFVKKIPIIRRKFVRFNKFSRFTNEFLSVKYCSKNYKDLFDFYVVGSDQVWNYTFPTYNTNMFLPFSNKNKNFSYAASFGLNSIDDSKKKEIVEGLNNLKHISVRENKAKEIIEKLTNRTDIHVVIDPTMLLTSDEWDKIMQKPDGLKEGKYILCYFLGELSFEKKQEISRISSEYDCEIINLLDPSCKFYNCGPSEFLYLEKNAFLICTDSFHSSVFAIIFDRPFVVFDRDDKEVKMNSRIDNLLNKFKLEDRKYVNKITDSQLNHDYKTSYKILEVERNKAIRYIEKILLNDI